MNKERIMFLWGFFLGFILAAIIVGTVNLYILNEMVHTHVALMSYTNELLSELYLI